MDGYGIRHERTAWTGGIWTLATDDFSGRDIGEQPDHSERCSGDRRGKPQVSRRGACTGTSILSDHRGLLDRVSRELIGQETQEAQALEAIFQTA